jgi:NADH dehydrogenase (ubiquinone) 1 beta subcomplex subunit 8
MLGIFSLEEYNVFTTGQAAQGMMWYIAGILSICGVVYMFYPDKPTVPRTFPGGLKDELGGDGAMIVSL